MNISKVYLGSGKSKTTKWFVDKFLYVFVWQAEGLPRAWLLPIWKWQSDILFCDNYIYNQSKLDLYGFNIFLTNDDSIFSAPKAMKNISLFKLDCLSVNAAT